MKGDKSGSTDTQKLHPPSGDGGYVTCLDGTGGTPVAPGVEHIMFDLPFHVKRFGSVFRRGRETCAERGERFT